MRTQQEIVEKINSVKNRDFLCAMASDLIGYLDYEHAKEYLKPEVTAEEWNYTPPATEEEFRKQVLKGMEEYMPFAWDKANDCRGISAGRSMQHYMMWVWLLGDESVFGDLEQYEYYGKDNLVRICEHYGWDHKQWDDGRRVNFDEY